MYRGTVKKLVPVCWTPCHLAAGLQVVEILSDSLTLSETPMTTKVARLMLASDVLHNSSAHIPKASRYRGLLETNLAEICESLQVNPLLKILWARDFIYYGTCRIDRCPASLISQIRSSAYTASGMPPLGLDFCMEEGP